MSAYELEKSLKEVSELIRREVRGLRKVFVSELICQRRVVEEDDRAHARVQRGRFERLERALEGLAGQAIAATNRDKRQLQALE